MKIYQKQIVLPSFNRGYHLITDIILQQFSEIKQIDIGILNVFIKHTSASLTINENADSSVRHDLEKHIDKMVPENAPYYVHTYEGSDDMPAHIKSSLLGSSIQIPITKGKLNLGTWQGIYLGEHRNHGGQRTLILSAIGS
jgi:secondary thiamine-phosphate synthase enzyme